MRTFELLSNLTNRIVKEKRKYNQIKDDEQKRTAYKTYGIHSIIFSIFAIASACSIFLLDNLQNLENGLLAFFALLFVIGLAFIAPLIFLANSLLYAILQIRINKKAIGYIALVLFVLTLTPAVFLVLSQIA